MAGISVVAVFAIVGPLALNASHAATYAVAAEAENGTVSGNTTAITDSNASGGDAVKFGPAPSGGGGSSDTWPDASSTGVQSGVTLTNYTGTMTITTPGTVIENKIISTNHETLRIEASNVTLRNVKVLGTMIFVDNDSGDTHGVLLTHLTVDGQGKGSTVNNDVAVGGGYGGGYELSYSNISGWDTGITINSEPANVYIHDNYVHDLGPSSGVHKTALSSNGGSGTASNLARIIHNNLDCGASGCSAAMSLYGDFAVISYWDVEDNLFNTEGSYCSYTGSVDGKKYPTASHITWKNNVYGRAYHSQCGIYGYSTSWSSGNSNVWSGNVTDTGATVNP